MVKVYIKNYKSGEIILKEGEAGDKAFIINRGTVQIVKTGPDKNFYVIAELCAGEIFGEMCLLDNKPRSASAVASSNVEVRIVYREDFLKLLSNTPADLKIILEFLLNRLRNTSNLLSNL